jgi:N-acetylglucosaminyl-diphospho-decaprenol L-rhamnosyltransferase
MAGMDVSVFIISFNTRDYTLACLQSVFEQTVGIEYEVIVVDNASSDGSADVIATQFPQVKLIRSDENLGFSRANNLAARSGAGRYFLLLNSDTVVLDNAIGEVVRFADERSDTGVLGGRTLFADGSLNLNSCHGVPTPWSLLCMGTGMSSLFRRSRWFDPESLGGWQRDSVREVGAVTGCFLLIRRVLWEQLNGFDESFFMYGEDTDLCIRAARHGTKCMVYPKARLIHYGGKSETQRADKMVKLFTAKSQLIQKHWNGVIRKRFGVAMLQLWAFSRMVACRAISVFRPSTREGYVQWRQVWIRRAEFG